MSEPVFRDSSLESLGKTWSNMLRQPTPKKPALDLIGESTESEKIDTPPVIKEQKEVSTQVLSGSKFDSVFKTIIEGIDPALEDEELEDEGLELAPEGDVPPVEGAEPIEEPTEDLGTEEEYEEDKMVEVPLAVLKELLSYLEDPMSDEFETDVDDVDFDVPEESYVQHDPKPLTKVGKGKATQNHKVKQSANKTGKASCCSKTRDGSVEVLKNILKQLIQTGCAKQPNKLSVGDQVTVK